MKNYKDNQMNKNNWMLRLEEENKKGNNKSSKKQLKVFRKKKGQIKMLIKLLGGRNKKAKIQK